MSAAARVRTELGRLYPLGYQAFSLGGRRVMEPITYLCTIGLRCLINGEWHIFDHAGNFVSSGYHNRVVGHQKRHA